MSNTHESIAHFASEERRALPVKLLQQESRTRKTFPLSFAQARLWFINQLQPGDAFYNIPMMLRLPGNLDIVALERSLNEIVRRHETLRTAFEIIDGKPVQVVTLSLQLKLPIIDLRSVPDEFREAEAQRLGLDEGRRPFDLTKTPLIRVTLLKMGDADHVLAMVIHHIIADGWSANILYYELSSLYIAYSNGQPSPLPELPAQYGDFAQWQTKWLSGDVLKRHLAYWRKQLAGLRPVLELPTDRPYPEIQRHRGSVLAFSFDPGLRDDLMSLSLREGTTLFMTMLAAFKTLLYRYTGQTDLIVGSPIANRTRPELEGLIGFFANTLVLRTDLSGDPTFVVLLARIREVTLGAFTYQDMPFEKLVEEIGPERSLAYNPLFQVMFVLQNAGKVLPEGAEHQDAAPQVIGTGVAKFDLTAFLGETTTGMQAGFEYNSDLFDLETVVRMAKHYQSLLAAAVDNPDCRLSVLSMLSQAEMQEIKDWNATQAPFPALCVSQRFESQAEQTPEALALLFEGEALRYSELNARANFWAQRLIELGAGPDKCVGIYMERSIEMIVAALAVLKAGGAYLPLDPNYPRERLAFMLADARASLLLTQQRFSDKVPGADAQILLLDGEERMSMREDNPPCQVTLDHLAYVIYTSGSTGQPKGVAMPHRHLANLLHWQMSRSALPAGARTLQFASLSFDVSFQDIFSTLCGGGTLVLISEERRRDPDAMWRVLRSEEVNRLFLPYVALQQLAERAREIPLLPGSLREIITAGEQLQITPQIAQMFSRLNCAFYNQYGPTETHVVTELPLSGPPSAWPVRPPIGRPLANVTVHILDAHMKMVPVGVSGEIYIGGIAPARGYLNRDELTEVRFILDSEDERLYRTGDRARYLRDGNIEFLGRFDDQVKIRGFRVEPGEVESALRQHKSVREAAVVPSRDASDEPRLIAYVQFDPEAPALAQELRAHLSASLPDYMIPSAFVMLDSMPLTPSGKINRRMLPKDSAPAVVSATTYLAPRTPAEEALARIWGELLRVERVGIHDNFFELGGHSLLATRLVARIRDDMQVDIPLRRIFDMPSIEALALLILQANIERQEDEVATRLLEEIEQIPEDEVKELFRKEATERPGSCGAH
jgi:amino acid adenylation domain-containing protein